MLDFPATPTTGQIFNGTNGVTYRWNGTIWVATGSSAGGDFMATHSTTFGLAASPAVVVMNTVTVGNSGSWYSTSTGRYTPPAGRYAIRAQVFGNLGGAITNVTLQIRKNGVVGASINDVQSLAGNPIAPSVAGTFDASGTDYFEVFASSSNGAGVWNSYFQAFPISGIQGPPGPYPSGAVYMYSEHVLASPSTSMTVDFPVGAKRVELDIWWTTSPLADLGALALHGMSGASPVTTATYNTMADYFRADGTSAGSFASGATSFGFSGNWAQAHGRMTFQRPSAGYGTMHMHVLTAGGARYQLLFGYEGSFVAGTFTGYRLSTGGGNFAVGSFMRCYVGT